MPHLRLSTYLVILYCCFGKLVPLSAGALRSLYAPGNARQTDKSLIGVWQEVAYGRIIRIHERGFDLYHTTKLLCYRDPQGNP